MTINEIDKFRTKLESIETNDKYIQEQKQKAIACLMNICNQLDYQGKKFLRVKAEER